MDSKEYGRLWRERNPDKVKRNMERFIERRKAKRPPKVKSSKELAKEAGNTFYTGSPCYMGHSGVRYTASSNCVECDKILHSPVRAIQHKTEEYKEWLVGYGKEYRRRDVRRSILSQAKSRAKARGLEFTIDKEDIILVDRCPVLGLELSYGGGQASYSLDRIDNSKGYVKGNVRIISNRANRLKSDAALWEIEAILNDLKSLQDSL